MSVWAGVRLLARGPVPHQPGRTQPAHVSRAAAHPHVHARHARPARRGRARVPRSRALRAVTLVPRRTRAALGARARVVARDPGVARVVPRAVVRPARLAVPRHVGRTRAARVAAVLRGLARDSLVTRAAEAGVQVYTRAAVPLCAGRTRAARVVRAQRHAVHTRVAGAGEAVVREAVAARAVRLQGGHVLTRDLVTRAARTSSHARDAVPQRAGRTRAAREVPVLAGAGHARVAGAGLAQVPHPRVARGARVSRRAAARVSRSPVHMHFSCCR